MASATYAEPDPEQYHRKEGFKQSIVYATLTARVKPELLVNNNTHGLAINVDSKDGVVTLSGEVESSTEKMLAERIASNVNGTESVSNQLVVEPRNEGREPGATWLSSFDKGAQAMNEYRLKGDWNLVKGRIKQKWGALTDDEIRWIDGSSDQLVGLVQMRYGRSMDQANREVREWRNEAGV